MVSQGREVELAEEEEEVVKGEGRLELLWERYDEMRPEKPVASVQCALGSFFLGPFETHKQTEGDPSPVRCEHRNGRSRAVPMPSQS